MDEEVTVYRSAFGRKTTLTRRDHVDAAPSAPTPAPYSYSKPARDRRQACWQAGKDFASGSVVDAALGASIVYAGDPYEQYLFLQGVADHLTAVGRDLVGLDRREGPVEGKKK